MVSRWLLRKCTKCGSYTLRKDKCPCCGGPLRIPHPPKFSPEDKYGRYRRMMKKLAQQPSSSSTAATESSGTPP